MNRYLYVLLIPILWGNLSFGQVYNPDYAEIADKCSIDTLLNNLQIFESNGVKELGSAALESTKNWIIDKYSAYGYTDILVDIFSYSGMDAANIIATKRGSLYPDTCVIIGAHYDTRNGPGANDNGSGTVALLEIARLLEDYPTDYSIKFIHFSAEEPGFIGSTHYVENVAIPGDLNIKLVFNIDGIGGVQGMINNTVLCERDEISPPFTNNEASAKITDHLANCVSMYSSLTPEISGAYGSDYIPFEFRNYIITGLYEKNTSPQYHTPEDVIDNLDIDYIYEVTRAAVGASLHFSETPESATRVFEHAFSDDIRVYPNPASNKISVHTGDIIPEIHVRLSNHVGQVLYMRSFRTTDHFEINMRKWPAGVYFMELKLPSGESKMMKFLKK